MKKILFIMSLISVIFLCMTACGADSLPQSSPATTEDFPINDASPQENSEARYVYTTDPPTLPPVKMFSPSVTSMGETVEPECFVESAKYIHQSTYTKIERGGRYITDALLVSYKNLPLLCMDADDVTVDTDGGDIKGYSVFEQAGTAEKPEFRQLETEIEDLSDLADSPGYYIAVISIEYSYEEENWDISVVTNNIFGICVLRPGEAPPDETPSEGESGKPGGSLHNNFLVYVGEEMYVSRKYMLSVNLYREKDGMWMEGDGLGAYDGIRYDPSRIPEIDYDPSMYYLLGENATLRSITLTDTTDLARRIEIDGLSELARHRGIWYVVFNVSYQGESVDGHSERLVYEHVIKLTVGPLPETVGSLTGEVSVSNGFETVKAESFTVSSRLYDEDNDRFIETDGEGIGDRLPEVSSGLDTFNVTRGMEIGHIMPHGATLNAITVYDAEFNELSVGLGDDFTAIATLPAGEYYVVLRVCRYGLYYPDHDIVEEAMTDEVFRLSVSD